MTQRVRIIEAGPRDGLQLLDSPAWGAGGGVFASLRFQNRQAAFLAIIRPLAVIAFGVMRRLRA